MGAGSCRSTVRYSVRKGSTIVPARLTSVARQTYQTSFGSAPSPRQGFKDGVPPLLVYLPETKTSGVVVINQTDCLHKRIADGGSHKLETALRQILTQRIGKG